MSNYNRKIERTRFKSSNMVSIFERYSLGVDRHTPKILEIDSYNKEYFESAEELVIGYELFFNDYMDFLDQVDKDMRVIEFLEDSVENNYMLEDYLEEIEFNVVDDHIYFNENDFVNMGEFYIDNYKVNVCGSYMFFEDLKPNSKKFMYYGD